MPIGMGIPVTRTTTAADREVARERQVRSKSAGKLAELERKELDRLVQRVFLSKNGDSPHIVVFSGVDESSESAAVCARAAQALADQSMRRVCMVEADTHDRPLFAAVGLAGDGDRHNNGSPSFPACIELRSNLWIADSAMLGWKQGQQSDTEELKIKLREARLDFDYILINSVSAGSYCDAAALGRAADGLILVLEASSTRRRAAQTVAENLKAAEVNLLGAVLDKRTYPIPDRLYRKL